MNAGLKIGILENPIIGKKQQGSKVNKGVDMAPINEMLTEKRWCRDIKKNGERKTANDYIERSFPESLSIDPGIGDSYPGPFYIPRTGEWDGASYEGTITINGKEVLIEAEFTRAGEGRAWVSMDGFSDDFEGEGVDEIENSTTALIENMDYERGMFKVKKSKHIRKSMMNKSDYVEYNGFLIVALDSEESEMHGVDADEEWYEVMYEFNEIGDIDSASSSYDIFPSIEDAKAWIDSPTGIAFRDERVYGFAKSKVKKDMMFDSTGCDLPNALLLDMYKVGMVKMDFVDTQLGSASYEDDSDPDDIKIVEEEIHQYIGTFEYANVTFEAVAFINFYQGTHDGYITDVFGRIDGFGDIEVRVDDIYDTTGPIEQELELAWSRFVNSTFLTKAKANKSKIDKAEEIWTFIEEYKGYMIFETSFEAFGGVTTIYDEEDYLPNVVNVIVYDEQSGKEDYLYEPYNNVESAREFIDAGIYENKDRFGEALSREEYDAWNSRTNKSKVKKSRIIKERDNLSHWAIYLFERDFNSSDLDNPNVQEDIARMIDLGDNTIADLKARMIEMEQSIKSKKSRISNAYEVDGKTYLSIEELVNDLFGISEYNDVRINSDDRDWKETRTEGWEDDFAEARNIITSEYRDFHAANLDAGDSFSFFGKDVLVKSRTKKTKEKALDVKEKDDEDLTKFGQYNINMPDKNVYHDSLKEAIAFAEANDGIVIIDTNWDCVVWERGKGLIHDNLGGDEDVFKSKIAKSITLRQWCEKNFGGWNKFDPSDDLIFIQHKTAEELEGEYSIIKVTFSDEDATLVREFLNDMIWHMDEPFYKSKAKTKKSNVKKSDGEHCPRCGEQFDPMTLGSLPIECDCGFYADQDDDGVWRDENGNVIE